MSNKKLRRAAEIVAGLLRGFEVPVFIQQETAGRIFGLTMGTLGMIKVLVPAQFEPIAVTLLDEQEPDPNTLLDDGNIIIFPEDGEDEYF